MTYARVAVACSDLTNGADLRVQRPSKLGLSEDSCELAGTTRNSASCSNGGSPPSTGSDKHPGPAAWCQTAQSRSRLGHRPPSMAQQSHRWTPQSGAKSDELADPLALTARIRHLPASESRPVPPSVSSSSPSSTPSSSGRCGASTDSATRQEGSVPRRQNPLTPPAVSSSQSPLAKGTTWRFPKTSSECCSKWSHISTKVTRT